MENFIANHINLNMFEWYDVMLRLTFAALFGLFLGLDRDNKNKPVDFRVYIIVCMTTTVITIMAQELNSHYGPAEQFLTLDLGKIISGVLTGIGFLGAGAIIKINDDKVIGTATGASIWASGGMGLCLGFGLYGLAFLLFATQAVVLVLVGKLVSKYNSNTNQK